MTSAIMAPAIRMRFGFGIFSAITLIALSFFPTGPARAQVTPFMQAVAEAAATDADIAAFYKANGYEPLWTGNGSKDRNRRAAFLKALKNAGDHALPVGSYNTELLQANLRKIDSQRQLGQIEVEMSRV